MLLTESCESLHKDSISDLQGLGTEGPFSDQYDEGQQNSTFNFLVGQWGRRDYSHPQIMVKTKLGKKGTKNLIKTYLVKIIRYLGT